MKLIRNDAVYLYLGRISHSSNLAYHQLTFQHSDFLFDHSDSNTAVLLSMV